MDWGVGWSVRDSLQMARPRGAKRPSSGILVPLPRNDVRLLGLPVFLRTGYEPVIARR
jgi:hypothetical protein